MSLRSFLRNSVVAMIGLLPLKAGAQTSTPKDTSYSSLNVFSNSYVDNQKNLGSLLQVDGAVHLGKRSGANGLFHDSSARDINQINMSAYAEHGFLPTDEIILRRLNIGINTGAPWSMTVGLVPQQESLDALLWNAPADQGPFLKNNGLGFGQKGTIGKMSGSFNVLALENLFSASSFNGYSTASIDPYAINPRVREQGASFNANLTYAGEKFTIASGAAINFVDAKDYKIGEPIINPATGKGYTIYLNSVDPAWPVRYGFGAVTSERANDGGIEKRFNLVATFKDSIGRLATNVTAYYLEARSSNIAGFFSGTYDRAGVKFNAAKDKWAAGLGVDYTKKQEFFNVSVNDRKYLFLTAKTNNLVLLLHAGKDVSKNVTLGSYVTPCFDVSNKAAPQWTAGVTASYHVSKGKTAK